MVKFFITVGIILFIILMLWLIWVIYSRIISQKIMREGRNKKNFAFNFLSTRFSRYNTMKDVRVLIKNSVVRGEKIAADIGTVFVNKGGVLVIETVGGSGYIDITEKGQWNRIINDKYYSFEDPFIKNAQRVKQMKLFLRSEGVENVPVHNIVLFSGKRVKFSKRLNGLITADELTPFMIDLRKDKFLTSSEIRFIVKLIRNKQA